MRVAVLAARPGPAAGRPFAGGGGGANVALPWTTDPNVVERWLRRLDDESDGVGDEHKLPPRPLLRDGAGSLGALPVAGALLRAASLIAEDRARCGEPPGGPFAVAADASPARMAVRDHVVVASRGRWSAGAEAVTSGLAGSGSGPAMVTAVRAADALGDLGCSLTLIRPRGAVERDAADPDPEAAVSISAFSSGRDRLAHRLAVRAGASSPPSVPVGPPSASCYGGAEVLAAPECPGVMVRLPWLSLSLRVPPGKLNPASAGDFPGPSSPVVFLVARPSPGHPLPVGPPVCMSVDDDSVSAPINAARVALRGLADAELAVRPGCVALTCSLRLPSEWTADDREAWASGGLRGSSGGVGHLPDDNEAASAYVGVVPGRGLLVAMPRHRGGSEESGWAGLARFYDGSGGYPAGIMERRNTAEKGGGVGGT